MSLKTKIGGLPASLRGLLVIAIGLFFGWLSVWRPLSAAQNHENEVSLHMKGVVFFPLFVLLGLFLFATGDSISKYFESEGKPTRRGWVVTIVVASLSFAFYFWFKNYLSTEYGYLF